MNELLERSQEIVRGAVADYKPYATVMMFSGGRDSMLAYQVAKQLGVQIDFVLHGNTRTVGAHKTRLLEDIVAEIDGFFDVARAEGIHPGGVHLEMTGADVTECLGGSAEHVEADLPRRYLTHCDPRLNERQALDVASAVARLLQPAAVRASVAA